MEKPGILNELEMTGLLGLIYNCNTEKKYSMLQRNLITKIISSK